MRIAAFLIVLLALAPPLPGRAADKAGVFDYYVLALSWNAAWCEADGAARGAPQCDRDRDIGFVLHGLWPQYLDGWPAYCATDHRDPSRAETAAMADIMGSAGLAWHEWKKHGRCSGLDAAAYFALARQAWNAIRRPAILRQTSAPLVLDPEKIEGSFLAENPGFAADSVTVTCKAGVIREVRICLARDLSPRPCTGPAARGCGAGDAI
ncbi:MAG TPA: ribonuclease T2, partial [Thermohalobaculum sp.]|nr:ribonuclease T2 [Thermohalobaculum sp.]